ncbi:hypothetical protein CEXT_705111 [Caerostris extrusa]|uniref:Uncharacterized protein n=1 Tax=Caerostris extrusa TaxID=172846 RepID=A0AAV4NSI8_CAEEX|nr:hypothetical protein CEXT_705111 [Caerostris extrusa]
MSAKGVWAIRELFEKARILRIQLIKVTPLVVDHKSPIPDVRGCCHNHRHLVLVPIVSRIVVSICTSSSSSDKSTGRRIARKVLRNIKIFTTPINDEIVILLCVSHFPC